ncbi:MAG: hypothetical protein ACRC2S_27195 [Waterburya sp.]
MKTIKLCLLIICLSFLVSCGQVSGSNPKLLSNRLNTTIPSKLNNSNLAETPTPTIIKELNKQLEQYNPQVKIIAPQPKQIINQTNVSIQLQVDDLPLFQDDQLKLGNHLNLILDNEPARPIYNLDKSIILENLTPGTHSLRVFAARPWNESFKNDEAYAQTTFSILTETNDNQPDPSLPLLTYNNPTGTLGAEPIMLDFYLTNAPLHAIAKNNPRLKDWRIKATINGTSFLLENWQPVYLTGFNKGENWIQLELIDEEGSSIENTFNNTVRVINYDPQQTDTLAQLVTNKISLAEAQQIVEPKSNIQLVETPEIIEPSVKAEAETESKVEETTKKITPIEEQTEDNEKIITTSQDNNSQPTSENDTEEIITEVPEKPVIIPAPEIKKIKEVTDTKKEITVDKKNEKTPARESTESQVITITEDNSDSPAPIANLEIPQPESVEITEDEIAITVPSTETITVPESNQEAPIWWKKLLVGLRQKLEGLVKMLPNKV